MTVEKLGVFVLLLFASTLAWASGSDVPWIDPVSPRFFKQGYYDNYETPLIDPYNDTAVNICLYLTRKPELPGFYSWSYAPDAPKDSVIGAAAGRQASSLKEIRKFLEENAKETKEDWSSLIDKFDTKPDSYQAISELYGPPDLCGRPNKGIVDFFEFLKKMELTNKDRAAYLTARLELEGLCRSTSENPGPISGASYEAEASQELDEFVTPWNELIGESKLKERISDYLHVLAASYLQQEPKIPEERKLALLKTNIEFIRDSYTYYAIRVLSSAQDRDLDPETAYDERRNPIKTAKVPAAVANYFAKATPPELWKMYVEKFPRGRFILSAKGLQRRAALRVSKNEAEYLRLFEEYLHEPGLKENTLEDCQRLAEEIESNVTKLPVQHPLLFTIQALKALRSDWRSDHLFDSLDKEILGKDGYKESLADFSKEELAPSQGRWFFVKTIFAPRLLSNLETIDAYKRDKELLEFLKVVFTFAAGDLQKVSEMKVASDMRPALYYSALRFKAWALESEKKYAEALVLWKEIAGAVKQEPRELVSKHIPVLENYALSKTSEINWEAFQDHPVALAHFAVRFLDDAVVLEKLRGKTLDPKARDVIQDLFLKKSLLAHKWETLVELEKLPGAAKLLPKTLWKSVEVLAKNPKSDEKRMDMARYLLEKGSFIESLRASFGTLDGTHVRVEWEPPAKTFLSIVESVPESQKSNLEAEALSHLSKCVGREYKRDKFCFLVGEKISDEDRKAWFKKLHRKYKGSVWAKKTPYYY